MSDSVDKAAYDVDRLRDEVKRLKKENATSNNAAEKALDAIAAICGCPKWDYPGQVIRDVERLARDAKHATETLVR